MDAKFLGYYERELQFIRDMAGEFAKDYPKVASHLALDTADVSDPYVERLLEGFSFLTARLHLRMDAQYPRFLQSLLQQVYPSYLAPRPSATVVQFELDEAAGADGGIAIDRGTRLRATKGASEQTACEFVTTQPCELVPVAVTSVDYATDIAALKELAPPTLNPRAALRLKLKTVDGIAFQESMIDRLTFYLSGQTRQAHRLLKQLSLHALGIQVSDVQQRSRQFIESEQISLPGLDEENSLLPRDTRYFSGFALLGEYFHFPEKFLFAQMSGLTTGLARLKDNECILTVFLSEADQELIGRVTADDFSLNCAPAINLFSRRTDRMRLDTQHEEHHLLVDRTRPADFEVYSVESVSGFSEHNEEHRFARLYDSVGKDVGVSSGAFFSQRFDKRLASSSARKFGARSAYRGSEVFLSLVDQNEAPYPASMRHLEAQVFCTNRDLPINIAVGRGSTDFSLDINAPVNAIRAKAGPTRPKEGLALEEGALTWRAVNHLSTNYLSLVEGSPGNGARAIRDLLALYGDESDSTIRRQIESLQSVAARRVTRRLPTDGPITYGRGLQVTVNIDESGFAGFGSFLLTRVLERFFSRYVSINSFTETRVIFADSKEEILWPPTVGHRHLL